MLYCNIVSQVNKKKNEYEKSSIAVYAPSFFSAD